MEFNHGGQKQRGSRLYYGVLFDTDTGGWHGNSTNNCSDDGTQPGGGGQNGEVTFKDETGTPPDLRLDATDSVARENGADLQTEFFDDDIEGESRPGQSDWDIGADEYISNPTINYRSIGTSAANLMTGSPTITITSGTATFSGAQTGNIGPGDKITYDTSSVAYITAKTSNTVFTLQQENGSAAPDTAGAKTVNAINRAYNTLQAWEDAQGWGSRLG